MANFLALLIALQALSQGDVDSRNTLAIPNNIFDRWPGSEQSSYRWVRGAPSGKRPFLIVSSSDWPIGQIAVRWASDATQPSGAGVYYVAMRQTPERLEEADSRECAYGDLMQELREIVTPEMIIPGTSPVQQWPEPQAAHGGDSITLMIGRQQDNYGVVVNLTASNGNISNWVRELFEITSDCWKPMDQAGSLP